MILLNEKPMTTKRPMKNFNYMEDLSKKITENLRKIIALRKLKQSVVGEFADISESQFSRVLSGSVQLSINQLANIASGLNMSVIDIITYPDIYVLKDKKDEDESEVLLQFKLRKEKKDQIIRLLFGENNIEISNK